MTPTRCCHDRAVNNPHALPDDLREDIVRVALAFVGTSATTVTLHGSKYPEGSDHWDLGEVGVERVDGRKFSWLAEQVYDSETGGGLTDEWDDAQAVLAGVHAAAWTFDAPEPWLAVVDLQDGTQGGLARERRNPDQL